MSVFIPSSFCFHGEGEVGICLRRLGGRSLCILFFFFQPHGRRKKKAETWRRRETRLCRKQGPQEGERKGCGSLGSVRPYTSLALGLRFSHGFVKMGFPDGSWIWKKGGGGVVMCWLCFLACKEFMRLTGLFAS